MPPASAAWIASDDRGAETVRTDTLEPSALASASPCSTPLSASSEPSVAIRMCLYIGDLRLNRAHKKYGHDRRVTGSTSAVHVSDQFGSNRPASHPAHQLPPHHVLDDAHSLRAGIERGHVGE